MNIDLTFIPLLYTIVLQLSSLNYVLSRFGRGQRPKRERMQSRRQSLALGNGDLRSGADLGA